MRKRFPAPKGLGPRSFASRYADSRKGRAARAKGKSDSKVKFLSVNKPIKFASKTVAPSPFSTAGTFLLGLAIVAAALIAIIYRLR